MKNRFTIDSGHRDGFAHHRGVAHFTRIIGLTVMRIFLAVVLAFLLGWFVMMLWNWLMPAIFGFKTLSYLQGFGLVILCKLLFGGIHHAGHPGRGRHMNPRDHRDWAHDDEWGPAGDSQNWKQYRQYWKEHGKEDFQAYLNKLHETAPENGKKGD